MKARPVKVDDSYYRPQRSWGKVMFLQASVILLTGGGCLPQCMLGYIPPGSRHPPGADTHPKSRHPQSRHPPEQTPSNRRACWEIRSTRGRYASYWNAILFLETFNWTTFQWKKNFFFISNGMYRFWSRNSRFHHLHLLGHHFRSFLLHLNSNRQDFRFFFSF